MLVAMHVHNDLAGALHNVRVVESFLSLDATRSSLGDSVILCPFPTDPRRASRLCPLLTIAEGPSRSLARFTCRSVWRSTNPMSSEKGIDDNNINERNNQLKIMHAEVAT